MLKLISISIRTIEGHQKPVQTLGPHVAALGMLFYTGEMFPREYHNSIFIAQHGSWNRDDPIGSEPLISFPITCFFQICPVHLFVAGRYICFCCELHYFRTRIWPTVMGVFDFFLLLCSI